MPITRRQFLQGCSVAIAAMSGARLTGLGFRRLAYAAPDDNQEILVTIFLRGGIDGLNVVVPYHEAQYFISRPVIAVPAPGSPTNPALDLDGQFALHPAAAALHDLYGDGRLAVIHAAGLTSDTRSHFDAMEFMERGTPGNKTTSTGWMTRHLISSSYSAAMPAVAAGSISPSVLLGSTEAVSMANLGDFTIYGPWADAKRVALRQMYPGGVGATWLHQAGQATLNAVDIIDYADPGDYQPANGAVYDGSEFANSLMMIAQLVKLDVGLHVANIDLGGWDTHENQGEGGAGYFASNLQTLSDGLMAFYTDLLDYANRLTVVVMSEFGRRLRENDNNGTDHGHGNMMLVLGGNVNGGHVYTHPWPGLEPAALDEGEDLAITTDYRQVLSEILVRRLHNPNLGVIFPGLRPYQPLGVVRGSDLPIVYDPPGSHKVYLPAVQSF